MIDAGMQDGDVATKIRIREQEPDIVEEPNPKGI